ncbi:MAG: hypothetical protein ABEJ98_03520 [Candidatus Nanohaloarchaea archaeon]
METPVLKRRLNPFLLASTVLVLALLAGLSVMYQGQLSDILSEKKNLKDKLEQRNARISTLESRVSNLTQELSNTEQDLDMYIRRNMQLKENISRLENRVNSLQQDKENLENRISQLKNMTENLNLTIVDLNNTLNVICEDANLTDDGQTLCEEEGHNT